MLHWPPKGTVSPYFDLVRDGPEARELLNSAYAKGGGEVLDYQTWADGLRADPEFEYGLCIQLQELSSFRMVGFAQCWNTGFVKDIVVAEDWRRRGLGRAMMWSFWSHFTSMGDSDVRLKVEADNPSGAVKFYEAIGMERVKD